MLSFFSPDQLSSTETTMPHLLAIASLGDCSHMFASPRRIEDTAPSVPHYLHTLYHMLAPGGRLLVFGPLMYHWSGHGHLLPGDLARDGVRDAAAARSGGDDEEAGQRADRGGAYERRTAHLDDRYLSSLDYTWEEVRHMVQQSGFDIEEEETHIPARYTADATSMMKVNYDCVFMVARKRSS